MATFVPERHRTLPHSSAERRALDWLGALDDTWTVLHSVGIARHEHKRWAEADMVVVGPPGVLVVEVKGGRVLRRAGQWGFQDRWGRINWRREGPYEQVGGAEAVLRAHLRNAGVLPPEVPCGWAVLAPDSRLEGVGPEGWGEVTLDARDAWPEPTATVRRLIAVWARRLDVEGRLDSAGVRDVVASLRGDVSGSMTLRDKVRAVREGSNALTAARLVPLHSARHNRRLVVLTPRPSEAMSALPAVLAGLPDGGRGALVLAPSPAAASTLTEAAACDVAHLESSTLTVVAADRPARHSVDPDGGPRWSALVVVAPETFPDHLLARLRRWRLVGGTADGVLRVLADPQLNDPTADWARGAALVELDAGFRTTQEVLNGVAMLTGTPALTTPLTGPALGIEWAAGDAHQVLHRLLDDALLDHEPEQVCVIDAAEPRGHAPAPEVSQLSRLPLAGEASRVWPHEVVGLDFECLVVLHADFGSQAGRERLYRAMGCARTDLRLILQVEDRADLVAAAVAMANRGATSHESWAWGLPRVV